MPQVCATETVNPHHARRARHLARDHTSPDSYLVVYRKIRLARSLAPFHPSLVTHVAYMYITPSLASARKDPVVVELQHTFPSSFFVPAFATSRLKCYARYEFTAVHLEPIWVPSRSALPFPSQSRSSGSRGANLAFPSRIPHAKLRPSTEVRRPTRIPHPLSTPTRILVSGAQPGFIFSFPHRTHTKVIGLRYIAVPCIIRYEPTSQGGPQIGMPSKRSTWKAIQLEGSHILIEL